MSIYLHKSAAINLENNIVDKKNKRTHIGLEVKYNTTFPHVKTPAIILRIALPIAPPIQG